MSLPSLTYGIYAVTIFVSSFLLFQVQPLIGKHILPWFGGSSAVWVTALFFFMVALAAGYVYAQLLTWFSRTSQVIVHTSVLLLTAVTLYRHSTVWPSGITPAIQDVSVVGADPVWVVMWVLLVSIGLPFLVLSSTSSLLQHWYGQSTQREPFSLYAVSNAGSLLGLLSYPLLFERFLPTSMQGYWWVWGMACFGLLMLFVMVHYFRSSYASPVSGTKEVSARPTVRQFAWWLLVASVPIMTMIAVTDFVTGYVVAIPFLWVIPLALYLISFVVSFSGGLKTPTYITYVIVVVATTFAVVLLNGVSLEWIGFTLMAVFIAMFAIFHLCHEALYEHRPRAEHLTAFYVALSFGGIFASTVILVVSLYLLPLPIEFLLLLGASASFCIYQLLRHHKEFLMSINRYARPGLVFVLCTFILSIAVQVNNMTSHTIATERNFFGYKAVTDIQTTFGEMRRTLVHGVTNHGYQFTGELLQGLPVAYYSKTSGINSGFLYAREKSPTGLRVAVAGLGAGALAAYCTEDDQFDFFEIDQQVIDIAYEYFTYLDNCQNHTVVRNDARLELQELADSLSPPQYDLIVLDAYADDVMPIHLMTTEAIALYRTLLSEDGVLAIHISSRYLDLLPVISALAKDNDLEVRHLLDREVADYASPSHWTMLAKENIFSNQYFYRMEEISVGRPILWTDIYSSLLPIIKW